MPALHAKRVPEQLNALSLLLHDMFLHRSMKKLYRTLQNTHGYVAIRLPDHDTYCWVCAQAKSQRRGLHTHSQSALTQTGEHLCDEHHDVGSVYRLVTARVEVFDDAIKF